MRRSIVAAIFGDNRRAALAVDRKAGYPPFDTASEKRFDGIPQSALATAVGYHYFEGVALVASD